MDPTEGEVVDVVGSEVYVGSRKMELAAKFTPKSVGGLVGVLGSLTAPCSIQSEIQIKIETQIQIEIEIQIPLTLRRMKESGG